MGTANTDVNLRPDPSPNNDPIGVVTKGSRIRVLQKQNNWLQVEIVETARPGDDKPTASRGWLNGKYIDMD
jgi:uncharacterized protein YraI